MRLLLTIAIALLLSSTLAVGQEYYAQTEAPDDFSFSVGVGALNNLETDQPAYEFHAGKLWSMGPKLALSTHADATTDFDQSVLASGNVGVNWYPMDTEIKPYVGAAAGLGYANAAEDEELGLQIGGLVGAKLYEGQNLGVNIEANSNVLLNEIVDGENFPYTISGRIGVTF